MGLSWGHWRRGKQARSACGLAMIGLLLLAGCAPQASYMRKWRPDERIGNRWTDGDIREKRLSEDEAATFKELGAPDVIRFYRQAPTRERVYVWIYEVSNQVVWFVDHQRVDYVAVDDNTLPLSQAQRQTLEQKAFAGGILAGAVGALATGFILLDKDIGLRD
jgi:hypothetical protein